MNLYFDNMQELQDFIAWAGYARGPAPIMVPLPAAGAIQLTGDAQVDAAAILGASTAVIADAGETTAPHGEDKPKRTRRTKAELELDRATAAVTQAVSSESGAPVNLLNAQTSIVEQEPVAVETPAQTAIREATERARATKGAKEAAAESTFEQALEAAIATKEDPAPGEVLSVSDYVASRTAERPEVSQIDHLNLARAFVAKHGVLKYNETFALAGLQSNVMLYTPADCAVHAAVLEWAGSSQAA